MNIQYKWAIDFSNGFFLIIGRAVFLLLFSLKWAELINEKKNSDTHSGSCTMGMARTKDVLYYMEVV